MELHGVSIGFLGGGAMGGALIKSLKNSASPPDISVSDINAAGLAALASAPGAGKVHTTSSNLEVVQRCPNIVLAVKPQILAAVMAEIAPHVTDNHLIISIVVGIQAADLRTMLGGKGRIVRTMPNTPALVGAGATGLCPGPGATPADAALATAIFSAVGIVEQVTEPLLDAVTGVSGSGPAYVLMFMEAMADGGVRAGLPRDVSQRLAAATVFGTAKMAMETKTHTATLRDQVASPGGTTIEGIAELEAAGLRSAVIRAVNIVWRRAREMAKM